MKIKSVSDVITNSSSEVFIILLPIDCTDPLGFMQKLEKDLHYSTKHDPKYNEYEDSSSVMMDPQGKIHVTKDENLVETAKWLLRDFEVIDVWPDSLCLEDRYLTDSKTGLMSFNPDWKEDED